MTLFAALEVATETMVDRCHTATASPSFWTSSSSSPMPTPRELHVVLDNFHTHRNDDINQWLAKHPRITLHFTPTSASWVNLLEVFFGNITRQAIRRGSFDNVAAASAADPSSGPRPPTKSHTAPPVKQLQMRDTIA
jgi:hypothetical protein